MLRLQRPDGTASLRVQGGDTPALAFALTGAPSDEPVLSVRRTDGAPAAQFAMSAGGRLQWGDGRAATDVSLSRTGPGRIETDGELSVSSLRIGGGAALQSVRLQHVDLKPARLGAQASRDDVVELRGIAPGSLVFANGPEQPPVSRSPMCAWRARGAWHCASSTCRRMPRPPRRAATRSSSSSPISASRSEGQRRGAGLDLRVHGAGADDDHAVQQIGLLVAARFDARRARPDDAAALGNPRSARPAGRAAPPASSAGRRGAPGRSRHWSRKIETLRPAVSPPLAIVNATDESSESMPLVTRTTSLSVAAIVISSGVMACWQCRLCIAAGEGRLWPGCRNN